MGLIYDENPAPFTGSRVALSRLDPTKQAIRHYENSLYLTFMLQNGDRLERHAASKELLIAEKKIAYWKRNPKFDQQEYLRQCVAAKKKWSAR